MEPAFTDPAVPGLIRQANIQTLEFNGGGVRPLPLEDRGTAQADPDPTGHPDYASLPPQFGFDQFASVARATGAKTLVHVNYGTGTPAEAAAWVRYGQAEARLGLVGVAQRRVRRLRRRPTRQPRPQPLWAEHLGLLSTGDCNDDNTVCAPPAQTPFRPHWAMQLVGAMTRHGSAMVPVSSSNPLVIGHAVRGPGGAVELLVENDDPAQAAAAHFAVPGYHAVSAVQYGRTDAKPRPVAAGAACRRTR